MNDYSIILSESDNKLAMNLRQLLDSYEKKYFMPVMDVDPNELYGIKVYEEFINSKEILIVQTKNIQENEKVMDLVYLAYELKPNKILLLESEDISLKRELKSYIKKAKKNKNIHQLLDLSSKEKQELSCSTSNQENSNINDSIQISQEETIKIEPSAEDSSNSKLSEEIQTLSGDSTNLNHTDLDVQTIDPVEDITQTESSETDYEESDITEEILNLSFSLSENNDLNVEVTWSGYSDEEYSLRIFNKRHSKKDYRGYQEERFFGINQPCLSIITIDRNKFWLDNDDNNVYDILVELKVKNENNIFELIDDTEVMITLFYSYRLFSKSIVQIVDLQQI